MEILEKSDENEEVCVIASKVDKTHIFYECPFCYTIQGGRIVSSPFKKYGGFYRSARRTTHRHGSCGDISNRVETRTSHCIYNKRPVKITISDDTQKPPLDLHFAKNKVTDTKDKYVVKFN